MTQLKDVCRHIRSKQAGPFWVTVDLFFDSAESFSRYSRHPALSADLIHELYGADPGLVKLIPVENLNVLKISYPRVTPQGGMVERDMHSGQQYVRLSKTVLD